VLGLGVGAGGKLAPGSKADVHVYFRVERPTTIAYRFQLVAWPVRQATGTGGAIEISEPPAGQILHTDLRPTADGAFASDRWKPGDYIRERFSLALPASWRDSGDGVAIGLVAVDASGGKLRPTGAALASDPFTAVLGVLPLGSSPARRP
jgi:hypothetical protein